MRRASDVPSKVRAASEFLLLEMKKGHLRWSDWCCAAQLDCGAFVGVLEPFFFFSSTIPRLLPNSHAVITLFLLCCAVRQDSDSCAKISSLAKFNERRELYRINMCVLLVSDRGSGDNKNIKSNTRHRLSPTIEPSTNGAWNLRRRRDRHTLHWKI